MIIAYPDIVAAGASYKGLCGEGYPGGPAALAINNLNEGLAFFILVVRDTTNYRDSMLTIRGYVLMVPTLKVFSLFLCTLVGRWIIYRS